ncbi:TIGR03089 family protein [Rothia sp. P7181]|uniref:TIGR03089 family protein n=1 Tax=unclassified Rothia (in: high G+C Gram-positive bacteria) TaxID=2689056 RepID=UPI003AD4C9A3
MLTQKPSQNYSFEKFFTTLKTRQSPALIWYSTHSERIELSGRVLENWVSKTANLLSEECELDSSEPIHLNTSTHWRSIIIALAALRIGAQLQFTSAEEECADIFCTDNTDNLHKNSAEYQLMIEKSPLAPRFMGVLPDDTMDYCALVRSYGDVYHGLSTPSLMDTAWEDTSYQQLLNNMALTVQETSPEQSYDMSAPTMLNAKYLQQVLHYLSQGKAIILRDPNVLWSAEEIDRILREEKAVCAPNL